MASSTSSSTESTKLEISVMYFGSEPYNISLESTGRGHENRVGVSGTKSLMFYTIAIIKP